MTSYEMTSAFDYFTCLPKYRVVLCKICHYCVWPDNARTHLREKHSRLPKAERALICDELQAWQGVSQSHEQFEIPKAVDQPVQGLRLFQDGKQCRLEPEKCSFVCRSMDNLKKHWRAVHSWTATGRRGGSRAAASLHVSLQKQADAWKPVCCQRFFHTGRHTSYFTVLSEGRLEARDPQQRAAKPTSIAASVLQDLATIERDQEKRGHIASEETSEKETSPWLQLTRWLSYLHGHCLLEVAALVRQPDAATEPVLLAICNSLERVVEDAYQSVCNDSINVFDQVRINSFLQRPSATDRPLLVKLQKSTWRHYTRIWKALLCFVYRTVQPDQKVLLRHQLTSRQTVNLYKVIAKGEELAQRSSCGETIGAEATSAMEQLCDDLDMDCLELCISLLDHDLKGDLFESAVVGFLAAIAVDPIKGILKEAYHFTPTLSGFIKIAQMLVIQKAVVGARDVPSIQPADLLDEMRLRFLINGVRSPFSWASQLRVYGKKVRDSTTCLGYISWSDDGLSVSYKGVRHLDMSALRNFVRDQLEKAQAQLEKLLLLHTQEKREDLDIRFWIHRVVDDPTENQKGWSFLRHPQNLQSALPDREMWLLKRVLETPWLQEEFIHPESIVTEPTWNQKVCQDYLLLADAFLERLLLLIHLTAGQPARGSEVLSLRHVNTVNGHHRNVFIEGGMVSTVTTYHKGYSTTGNTKIIHRYLPKEVGELLIYYLWLVQPFCRKLEMLALRRRGLPSPFLWAKRGSLDPWDSSRLSRVLQIETKEAFGVALNISVYRHLAVAISRKHLKCGGFKRDYGLEESGVDKQGSHTSWTAGTTYARGLEEAAGHVEARKSEYRRVSQEWHQFLGFTPCSLPSQKRPLENMSNKVDNGLKRLRPNSYTM